MLVISIAVEVEIGAVGVCVLQGRGGDPKIVGDVRPVALN